MFEQIIDQINNFVWGPVMLALLLVTGIFLTIGLKGMTISRIPYAFRQLFKGREGSGEGEITPFNALMTSLSSTLGMGNIPGVATAIGGWPRRAVLDVVCGICWHGYQICGSSSSGQLPRN